MKWWWFGLFVVTVPLSVLYLFQIYDQQTYAGAPLTKLGKCPYTFINQQRCEPDLAPKKREYVELRNDLNAYIDSEQKAGRLTHTSIYFRDLQNGPSISINAQEIFIPASLLKLPLMITYYKKAENNADLLKQEIHVADNASSLDQNIKPTDGAQPGGTYTRDRLIELLITQSDNISWITLLNDLRKNFSEEDFIATLSDLGIVDPRKEKDQQFITVQNYASVFRILYNSSYLNLEMSDKALEVLSRSQFTDGIVAGVPNNVKVAHKFGEQKNGEEQQLHDCGIVYYPPNPYVICVMTRGNNMDDLESTIQKVSRDIYKEVESRNAD
jgi:beta-lactamase class A